ncbi:DNA end-binding protein Ku [Nocardioides sp. J9]|uniref:non-homologous end joining protein Ku n=1 Tax=Nocardioides sp. J9 TaxID=935844 RepID=UPI0011A1478C|nr:Ku protein [Nocardioides sp. J9]TWG90188.1 DNA end-binding protein Ku [Nocardioides sp. J9]
MARSIWSGSLSFGLVNVPVGLYSATQAHEVHFHQFEEGTSSRIRYKRVNEDTGDEVSYGDIVKGAEVDDGEYVMLTQEELESVEPGKSRTIDISDFVDAAEIDPIYFQKSYYLAPSDEAAKKAYALLAGAMAKAERIGIATFVMRGKQYLAAVRPKDNVLVLETMYFADEVRDPAEQLDNLPQRAASRGKDLQMAVDLVEALTTTWDPENYRDTYTDRVEELVEAKKKDRVVVAERDPEAAGDKVVDLLTALQQSIEGSKKHRPGNKRAGGKLETREREAADVDLADLTKKELDALAKELDVKGRSRMTAAQLRTAIGKARDDAGSTKQSKQSKQSRKAS